MDLPYQPRGTGFDALDELDQVDWAELVHAYGKGVARLGHGEGSLGIAGDVGRSLAELRSDPSHAIAEGLYSTICHQGTVYEATAYAVPFIVAVAEGDVPDGIRAHLVALVGEITIAASFAAPDGSHAGALGDGVDVLVTKSLTSSIERLLTIRTPELQALIAAIRSLLADPADEHREAVDSAIEALGSPAIP